LRKRNIKTVNIRPEDIVEGNSKLTLGLIWTIILNFQVSIIKQRQQEAGDQVKNILKISTICCIAVLEQVEILKGIPVKR
uniref:Calponin-homology (CH) domain-containing protein n=1 Tax=Gongylonema pulchrum TaxID=637853 RepID=A0A183CVP1_9BILA